MANGFCTSDLDGGGSSVSLARSCTLLKGPQDPLDRRMLRGPPARMEAAGWRNIRIYTENSTPVFLSTSP
jgi:hypothetical protein